MAFWSGEELLARLPEFIEPFDPKKIDCNSYELSIGREIYVTPHEVDHEQDRTKRLLRPGETFRIPAGQFAFLVTEEIVEVPSDAMAFISVKTDTKFKGLINVSGFHVDPGYRGNLIFSVYNAGPSPIHMEQGKRLFKMWCASLDRTSSQKYIKDRNAPVIGLNTSLLDHIPGEIYSLQSLSKQMGEQRSDLLKEIRDQRQKLDEKLCEIEKKQAWHGAIVGVIVALGLSLLGLAIKELYFSPATNNVTGSNVLPAPASTAPNANSPNAVPPTQAPSP